MREVAIDTSGPIRQRMVAAGPHYTELARCFLKHKYPHGHLRRWRGDWWVYVGHSFRTLSEEELKAQLWTFLDQVLFKKRKKNRDVLICPEASGAKCREMLNALASLGTILDGEKSPPFWTSVTKDTPKAESIYPVGNGLLDLESGELLEHSPKYFATSGARFNYRKDAECPNWLKFLSQLWPTEEEGEQIKALQQWFGYCCSARTDLQKGLLFVGPKRCGKGTIISILSELVGWGSVVSTSLMTLNEQFGLGEWPEKRLAIFPDVRMVGSQDFTRAFERLLSIIGQDSITIDRKFRDAVTERLRTRIMLVSNSVPPLHDAAGALASRFLVLRSYHSAYGREDLGLLGRLRKELPGILLWALEGLRSLNAEKRFVELSTTANVVRELEEEANPVRGFVEDKCHVGPEYFHACRSFYERWRVYAEENGLNPGVPSSFSRKLKQAVPGLQTGRPRRRNADRGRVYLGIQTKSAGEL